MTTATDSRQVLLLKLTIDEIAQQRERAHAEAAAAQARARLLSMEVERLTAENGELRLQLEAKAATERPPHSEK